MLKKRQNLIYMMIDLNDIIQLTWDRNIDTLCKIDNEIRDDLSLPFDFDWGFMFLPHSIVSCYLGIDIKVV